MTQTRERKSSHLQISVEKDVQARTIKTGFDDIHLIHRALPNLDLHEVDTTAHFFGRRLAAPIVIEAMTGGTADAVGINLSLARAAEEMGIAMGVGSQRAAIEDPKLTHTFKVVREEAPHAFLISNLGAPQLSKGYGLRQAQEAVEMIEADALAIHINPLQEAVQPEGEAHYRGVLEKVGELSSRLAVPIIAKETGAGIAAEEAEALEGAGVRGIDVGGAGGTSWAAVEYYRAKELKDTLRERLGEVFWDWGIPTAVSLVEARQSTGLTLIASGGVRTGIDAAKAVALGASAVGLAMPLLRPAMEGYERVVRVIQMLVNEFRTAMFLTGSNSIQTLQSSSMVITGRTAEWLRLRGFNLEKYAGRRDT